MYPNLKAEFARGGFTLEKVSKELGITIGTLSQKLNGKYPITLNEAKRIKEIIGTDIILEILFAEAS